MSSSAPQYLDLREAAEVTRCHPKTLTRAVRAGRLQALRFNGRWLRFTRDQLQAWLEGAPAAQGEAAK